MSSLRNAVKRKEHRERSQPQGRKKLGLLEKRKDYRQRADDFNRKKRTIQHLQGKAAERNPDEFYFSMEKSQTRNGVHIARSTEANKYSQAELALMRTQDAGYLRLKAQAEAKKTERLQATLHCVGQAAPHQRTLFAEEATLATTSDADLGEASDAHMSDSDTPDEEPAAAGLAAAKVSKRVQAQYRELLQRQERQNALHRAAHAVDMQRAVAGKGSKRKIQVKDTKGGTTTVWRWRSVRKK